MRTSLGVALLAALVCGASGAFRGQFANLFNSWNPALDVQYVKDFDHLAQYHPEIHEEEHTRKKRNAVEAAKFAAGNPITKACDRPGYTGQYCEFPICSEFNPNPNPEEYLRDDGYVIDLTDLGNCTRSHVIIVDESMYDIRIEVQSLENVSPQLTIIDSNGYIGTPDKEEKEQDRFVAFFNVLVPGYYTVQASAASLNSRCILTTTAQTIMTISGGFQTDDRDRNDFPNEDAGAHQFNSMLLHLNGARSPAELKTVSVIGPDNFMFRPRLLDKRYGCQYEYYFDSLFCFNKGSYAMIVEGVDFYGNPFRRTAPFDCVYKPAEPTPSSAPTTPAPTNPSGCANGGVLLTSGGKTSCICQDHWTGFDCSTPLCINGGTLLQGKCFCTSGFEGEHCEQVKCEPNSNHGFGVDKPTLVFVVRVREEMNVVMQQVQKAIDEVVENLQFDPSYLSRFAVVFFNDHTNFMAKHFTSIEQFDDAFLKATIATGTEGGCSDSVLGAVTTSLTDLALTQASTIYVITDALADDYDTGLEGLLQFNSYWRATINFLYIEPTAESQCISDVSDPGFRAFDDVANRFGGMAWHVDDRNKVYDVLYGHMNSIIYKSQLMLTLDREECGNGLGKVIQLEKNSNNLVFIAKGRDFTLEVIAPDGQALQSKQIVDQGLFTIQMTSDPIAGAYLVRTHTAAKTASCSVRAYQASYQSYTKDSPTEAFWAVTTDVDSDAWLYQPLAGIDNHPVFHIENYGESEDYDHAFAFLNMYAVRGGVEKEVYASNGLFRGGCTFHFYFPSFRCRPNENLHYEFNLRTEEGFYIQRGGVMTCFNSFPTPPTPGECQNGGVMFNETCLCQPHYEGEHCQSVDCANGGTPFFGVCQCPSGWTGPYCGTAECNGESGPEPNYGYHVDMAFLVEVTKVGVSQIQQLMTTLPEIIRDVNSQHPDWIDRLVLIGYNSENIIGMIDTPIDNTKKFFDTLNQWGNSNPTDDGCQVKIWPAIYQLLNGRKDGNQQRELPDRSIINIFEASLPNNDDDKINIISTSEELLERKTITNVFQYMDQQTGGWRCVGMEDDFVYLEQVARRGDGKMYTLGNGDLGRAVRMIPTLFSSSIVYKYHNEDCTMGHNIFFPVDAYTQTVTAVIEGNKALVHLNRYDGTPFTADGRIDILNDDKNQVVEFRNPCDADWDSISQYCMYFNPSLINNQVAGTALCQKMNGFMADDLSKEKNDWLKSAMAGQKAWLGLTKPPGLGTWYFQHDDGVSMPVPANINYWVDGKIPDGSTGTCAYFYQGQWYAADCDEKHLVVCQKHMFDSDNQPSDLGDDDLSPGKYYLFVQTDIEGSWKGCDVEVRVQSDLNVEFGFVDGLRKDEPHPVANIDSDQNRVVSSISIGKGETQTSILQHVQLRSDDASSLLLEAATLSYRLGCSYDYVSQPLSCEQTNGEDFSVVLIGEDDTGNTFQRYSTSLCYKWYVCGNGGVYSNGQCLCPDYYGGDSCRTPICQNDGRLNAHGNKCVCTAGFGGDACQYVQCDADSGATFSNDNKALILVIEKSENTADAIQNIADNFHLIQQNAWDNHQEWFKYFLLETFTVDGQIEDMVLYNEPDDLGAHLNQLAQEAKGVPGACQGQIWSALDHLFDRDLSKYLGGAEILLISAAAPLDADLASMHATMERFDTHTPVLDFIHVETAQCAVDDWATGLANFANFLTTTGGTVFRVDPATAGEAIQAFLPTRYAPQRISYSDPVNCQTNEMFVQIDTGMQEVFVSVSGDGASATVQDPLQQDYEIFELWTSPYQKLWRFNRFVTPGIYKITVNSKAKACFPYIYGNGGAQVFFGFIQNYNYLDTPKPYPVFGAVNFPVYYLLDAKTGNSSETETLYMAHMDRRSIGGDYEVPYDSDIDHREGCSYNYIGKSFTCLKEDDIITMSASGNDANNQPFTRQSTSYCKKDGYYTTSTKPVKTSPAPTVPTTTALTPATLNFDILFIIDETEQEGFIKNTAEPFIEKTMSIYTPTQRFARIGLITMPQKENKSMPVAFLSSVDSIEALDEDLTSLEDFEIAGTGEYLKQALSFANDPNKYKSEQHGYRNGISNHLIVILTAKNKFADIAGAIGEVQKIAAGQSYGVIAVGYGQQDDWSQLSDLAGPDCFSVAVDSASLLDKTTAFIQEKIWNAAFNGGQYCTPANIAMSSRIHH